MNPYQTSKHHSTGYKREKLTLNLHDQSRLRYIQESRISSQVKIKQQYTQYVEEMLAEIIHLTKEYKFDSEKAFILIFNLEAAINHSEFRHFDLKIFTNNIQTFSAQMAVKFDETKITHFQLLAFHADAILNKLEKNYIQKFGTYEVLSTLSRMVDSNSKAFLLRNATNSELWCQAVINQNFDLEEDLLEVVIQMINIPTQTHGWKILIDKANQVPYNEQICQIAWRSYTVPEVTNFILQKISNGDEYADEFMKLGIDRFYRDIIILTIDQKPLSVQQMNIQMIISSLRIIWMVKRFAQNDEQNTRILESVSDIPLNLFNIESIRLIYFVLIQIRSHSSYELNFLLSETIWFRKLLKMLLVQQQSDYITQKTIELMNKWSQEKKSCATMLKEIIKSYQEQEGIADKDMKYY